jgi:ribosome-associated protein
MNDVPVSEKVTIPGEELHIAFARSGGPGGQNVNKVETKVEIRWRVAESSAVAGPDREWLLTKLERRLTVDGDLLITSDRFRDQLRNREDAVEKLAAVVRQALERPKPRKRTRPPRAAVEQRMSEKKQRGRLKRERGESAEVG